MILYLSDSISLEIEELKKHAEERNFYKGFYER
jgi:hypothetical protein